MSGVPQRKFSIIVFGATGFTGKHVIEEIVKTVAAGHSESFTWAVAGRSVSKMREILLEVSKVTGTELAHVKKIIADVSDQESLEEMAAQCHIVLNTVGPYAKYGEAVIKACIKSRTNHLDISAESHDLTEMQLRYNEEAEAAGVYVVGSCGFDSIPNECGINHLQQKFNGHLNSVESYLYVGNQIWKSRINYGTWTSIVHFYAEFGKLRPLLRQLYPEELPSPKYKVGRHYMIHRNSIGETGWCLPFPHPDLWAVERSQNYFYSNEKRQPIQFVPYLKQSNIFITLMVAIGAPLLGLIMKIPGGVYLMDHFPRLFSAGLISRDGPTRAQMEAFKFSFTLIGRGWERKLDESNQEFPNPPDKSLVLKIRGVNPGYGVTSTCLLQAALTILAEKDVLPKKGGVYTPGTMFAQTSIVQRLHKHGLTFEFLD